MSTLRLITSAGVFEPTDKARNEYGLKVFFILGIPVMFAVHVHYHQNPPTKTKE
jgi:hypothetical protein